MYFTILFTATGSTDAVVKINTSGGLDGGAMAGVIIAVILVVLIVIMLVIYYKRRVGRLKAENRAVMSYINSTEGGNLSRKEKHF